MVSVCRRTSIKTSAYLMEHKRIGRGLFSRQNMSRTSFRRSLFPPILPSRDHSPGQREQEQDLRRRRYGGGPCCLACGENGEGREVQDLGRWRAGGGSCCVGERTTCRRAPVRSAPRGHPLVGAPHHSQTSIRRSQSLPPPPPPRLPPPNLPQTASFTAWLRRVCLDQSKYLCTHT